MKLFRMLVITAIMVAPMLASGEESGLINKITFNIESVCQKPSAAASFWEAKVKSDGTAKLNLLLGSELSVGAEFTKKQWDGIVSSVEDAIDYRSCVKEISPLFLEKYLPLLIAEQDSNNSRSIMGVKLMDYRAGVELTLESCRRRSDTAYCEFTAISDTDIEFKFENDSYLFDQNGNVIEAKSASISNTKRFINGWISANLVYWNK